MASDKPGAAQDLRVTVTFYDLKGAVVCRKEEVLAPGTHQKQWSDYFHQEGEAALFSCSAENR
jgi:hypothetical protein